MKVARFNITSQASSALNGLGTVIGKLNSVIVLRICVSTVAH